MPLDTGTYLTWRVLHPNKKRRCRWLEGHPLRICPNEAVAELNRGSRYEIWWAYCADHMFGRNIINGKVI